MQRIVHQPKRILDRTAPYWQGERAEQIVQHRVAARVAALAARKAAQGSRKSSAGTRPLRERSPSAQLRRLERALKRRKTLAGRQSVLAKIRELKRATA